DGSRDRDLGHGGVDDAGRALRALRPAGRGVPMTTSERREEVAVAELDVSYARLRLVSPATMARLRASGERIGMRNPVLVLTAIEPGRVVLVDGFKRVRVVAELGAAKVWATLVALDAQAAKVAMVAANAGYDGLCDLEEAWIVRALCRDHKLTQLEVGRALGR